jgi:hypothetical protein
MRVHPGPGARMAEEDTREQEPAALLAARLSVEAGRRNFALIQAYGRMPAYSLFDPTIMHLAGEETWMEWWIGFYEEASQNCVTLSAAQIKKIDEIRCPAFIGAE